MALLEILISSLGKDLIDYLGKHSFLQCQQGRVGTKNIRTTRECLMDWDDEYDSGYDDMGHASHREISMPDKSAEGGFDPMDIANPVSAYFFLSDDAQNEIAGTDKKR